MTLGIAIPTYQNHLIYLNDLLEQISNSTVLPNQVSVSISSVTEEINFGDYPFELIITKTPEYRNPAQNRNIAASNLSTDIISFIDGDDFPHIQRNEFILESFQNNEVTSLVHDYFKSTQKNVEFLTHIYQNMDLKINYVDTVIYGTATNINHHFDYHHAQVTVKKEVFIQNKFDENEVYKFREDSLYTKNLIDSGYKISVITNKLSQYNKD